MKRLKRKLKTWINQVNSQNQTLEREREREAICCVADHISLDTRPALLPIVSVFLSPTQLLKNPFCGESHRLRQQYQHSQPRQIHGLVRRDTPCPRDLQRLHTSRVVQATCALKLSADPPMRVEERPKPYTRETHHTQGA